MPRRPLECSRAGDAAPAREVVAVLLAHRGRLCLLRRSQLVGSDRRLWHCVTGFLEPGVDPARQALAELTEETGVGQADLCAFSAGPVLQLPDSRAGTWRVLVYLAESIHDQLRLNWEHDDACWVTWPTADEGGRELVPWLSDLVTATELPAAA